MKPSHVSLAVLVVTLAIAGCSGKEGQRVAAPVRRPVPDASDISEARWLTTEAEVREAVRRAAQSPLVQKAASEIVSPGRVAFLPSGVVAAMATMKDGSRVRFTILPYQYAADSTHACYVVLLEMSATVQVQTFELIRHREPGLLERGFLPVNSGEHGLWLREGDAYIPSPTGIVRLAPERFQWQRFATCFIPTADLALRAAQDGCNKMGNFPGCITFASTIAILGSAVYCALVALYK